MTEDDVNKSMRLLLNQKQIKYIKSQTYKGLSRLQMVRKLINMGIEADKFATQQIVRNIAVLSLRRNKDEQTS